MNQQHFETAFTNDAGSATVLISRPMTFIEKLIMGSLKRAHERFLSQSTFEALEAKDPALFRRFSEQVELLDNARRLGTKEDVKRHGEAMLRGYDAIIERMAAAPLDLNTAKPQKGAARHPGKPPMVGTPARKRWYAAYLESAEWMARRDKVIARAAGRCEGCGSADATQVHHMTYAHVGFEFLFELAAICAVCHSRLHGKTPP